MKAPAFSWEKKFTPQSDYIPEGKQVAIVSRVIDLGTQLKKSKEYGDKMKRQVRIEWELPKIRRVFNEEKWEQVAIYGEDYVFSLHEKSALTAVCANIMWKPIDENFDTSELIGKYCTMKFVHTPGEKGTKYVNIFSVADMDEDEIAKATEAWLVAQNEAFEFALDPFNQELFEKLPKWQQDKIATSDEYKLANGIEIPDGKFKIPAEDKDILKTVYPENKELIDGRKKENKIFQEGDFTEESWNRFKEFMLENGVDFDEDLPF